MFSPRTQITFLLPLMLVAVTGFNANAQTTASAEFQARMAAMQQAQARGQAMQVSAAPVRVAEAQTQVPELRTRVPRQNIPGQMASTIRTLNSGYQPGHTRTAQLITEGAIVDGGSPVVGESVLSAPMTSNGIVSSIPGQSVIQTLQAPVESGVVYSEPAVLDGCNSCGDSGGYFQDDCCGRGGCPDGVPCWQGPLGRALRTGSYFFGATAFRHPAYTSPVGTDLVHDCNFGAYAGFNLGIPLCRLFCGRISGQFGMRSVQTNFGGNEFTDANRDQLFVTAGLYRRVDYGLQAGLVVDVLAEEFFTESDIAQLRGEVSWAYPNGGALGFRFTSSQQSDNSSGVFDGTPFNNFASSTENNYRVFLRKIVDCGGFEEIYAGWTENDHFAVGADFDIPVAQYMAIQAGAVLYLSDLEAPDSNLGTTRIDDSFNLYVGFAFRPQGAAWYRSYDRPLLPVADNGTMLIRR
jgi:hypothetical protein